MIKFRSPAFEPGGRIPKKYSGEGEDVSPPLSWQDLPKGTQELALICEDPDAKPIPWIHWVVYGIPPDRDSLPEGSAERAKEGRNSSEKIGYKGPMPPPGDGIHRYLFKIYALSKTLDLEPGAKEIDLLREMDGHFLGKGEFVGTYER